MKEYKDIETDLRLTLQDYLLIGKCRRLYPDHPLVEKLCNRLEEIIDVCATETIAGYNMYQGLAPDDDLEVGGRK